MPNEPSEQNRPGGATTDHNGNLTPQPPVTDVNNNQLEGVSSDNTPLPQATDSTVINIEAQNFNNEATRSPKLGDIGRNDSIDIVTKTVPEGMSYILYA